MKLKELKQSLAKFGGDFDDCEVVFTFKESTGEENYDLVAGVGHDKNMESIFLIGLSVINRHLEHPINKKWKKNE